MLETRGLASHGSKEPAAYANRLRERLLTGQFALNFEITTPQADQPLDEVMEPFRGLAESLADEQRAAAIAVCDRVKSDFDHDPVLAGKWIAERSGLQPLVHWAGKDRGPGELADSLERLQAAGLENVLFLTGDRADRDDGKRQVQYLDSVFSVATAKDMAPLLFRGAVVSCFKYREEEQLNQYFKLVRKVRAGAQFIIAQVGFDPQKHRELVDFVGERQLDVPVMASLMSPSPRPAAWIRAGKVPGVKIPEDIYQLILEEAESADGGANARLRRLALQITGVQLLGYAGAQVTGINRAASVKTLLDMVDEFRAALTDWNTWLAAWHEALRLRDGKVAKVSPEGSFYLKTSAPAAAPTPATQARYYLSDAIDHLLFKEHSPGAPLFHILSKSHRPAVEKALVQLEEAIKRPMFGCITCGFCRLPYTQYVCPETCPKGLANGPCGGTDDNRCEFGDRECIHNERYRLAKARGALEELQDKVVPPVPGTRGTCSWTNIHRGLKPNVVQLKVVSSR